MCSFWPPPSVPLFPVKEASTAPYWVDCQTSEDGRAGIFLFFLVCVSVFAVALLYAADLFSRLGIEPWTLCFTSGFVV